MQQTPTPSLIEAPVLHVRREWIDQNGHMNVAFYLRAFDLAGDDCFAALGLGPDYVAEGQGTTFALEHRLRYLQEVFQDDPLRITFQILEFDEKRLHFFHRMYHGEKGYLSATMEGITLHVSQKTRRAAPFPPAIHAVLQRVFEAHRALPWPDNLERGLSLKRPA